MPELPEVETIARGLQRAVAGKQIAQTTVRLPKVVSPEPGRFTRLLEGDTVEQVGRRGKFVVFGLRSGRTLVVHLRMTGRLIVQPAETTDAQPYTNVLLTFADGARLSFADVRQFGRMRLVEPEEPWAAEVGFEPLSDDFTFERFSALLAGRTTPIKVFLLDQRRIAGIGNIYACEALWDARIDPRRPAGSLSRERRRRLHDAIRQLAIVNHASPFDRLLTVSIGLAVAQPSPALEPTAVFNAADKALYAAKDQGRNRTCTVLLGEPLETLPYSVH